jgi:hypothetical protein
MWTRLRRSARAHPNLILILLVLLAFGLAQLFLGTHATPIDSLEALQARLADGQPSVVEFYSNL